MLPLAKIWTFLKFATSPKGLYVIGGIAVAIAALYLYSTIQDNAVKEAVLKNAIIQIQKVKDAENAAAIADRCNRDPACLMSDDGYRR
jgi:hypothetical protein